MRALKMRVSAGLIACALAVVTSPTAASSAADNQCWKSTRAEKGFKRKLNSERLEKGLSRLRFDPELSKVARRHTKEMIQANKKNPGAGLFHSTSDQLRSRITNWNLVGENVGVGGTVSSLHVAFMGSKPHAANVLHDSYRFVGVGARRGPDDRMWVTVIFEGYSNPGTTLRMPSC